jgi:putative hydrolase
LCTEKEWFDKMLLKGDLHTHTVASTHAYSTVSENCLWAARYGLKIIAMTDHAPAMPDSPHIWHFGNLKCLPREIEGVTLLKGAEADILEDGGLDLDDKMLSQLEWVVASMHRYEGCLVPSTAEKHTEIYLKIAQNPHVDVIGHCTTAFFPFDTEKCLKAFKEYGKLVEINESSIVNKKGSRENSVEVLKLCKKYRIPVTIDSDAHFCQLVGQAPNALQMVEELDFPQELVINSDEGLMREFIRNRRPYLKDI